MADSSSILAVPKRDLFAPGGPMSYADEKFAVAVHLMAVSEGPLRERLREAWGEFHPVGEEDFPEGSQVRRDFVSLRARLTSAGTLDATLRIISDRETQRLAHLVCDVRTGILSAIDHARWQRAGR